MKRARYRGIEIVMGRNDNPAGVYYIRGYYKNKVVVAYTDSSIIYDYIDDEEQVRKQRDAVRAAYKLVRNGRICN